MTDTDAYDLGQLVRVNAVFKNAATQAVMDPDVVKLDVTDPEGTITTYTYGVGSVIIKDSVGNYHANIDVELGGFWYYRWYSTGNGQAAVVNRFEVSGPVSVDGSSGGGVPSDYAGQSTIVTVGTLTTGVWNATVISNIYIAGFVTTQSANVFLAGPTTGSPAAPTYRSMVIADLASLLNVPLGIPQLDADGNLPAILVPQSGTETGLSTTVVAAGALYLTSDTHRLVTGDGTTVGGLPTNRRNASCVYVQPDSVSNAADNASAVIAAYAIAKALTPYGSPLSATNRATVRLAPGWYNFASAAAFTMDTAFVDLVGEAPELTLLQFNGASQFYTLNTDNVNLRGLHFKCISGLNPFFKYGSSAGTQANTAMTDVWVEGSAANASCMSFNSGLTSFGGVYTRCQAGGINCWGGKSFSGGVSAVFVDCEQMTGKLGDRGLFGSANSLASPPGTTGTYNVFSGRYERLRISASDMTVIVTGVLKHSTIGSVTDGADVIRAGSGAIFRYDTLIPVGTGDSVGYDNVTTPQVHIQVEHCHLSGTGTSTTNGIHTSLTNDVTDPKNSVTGNVSPTVSSVGLSLPAQFTVSNSPVTSSGTLTAVWATELANVVFAGPGSGSAAIPTFRALVAADIPAIPESGVTNLTMDLAARALTSTTISVSGTGLSGGGSLASNRTITFDQTAITVTESQVTNLTTDLAAKTPTTRSISTTAPITGGGNLSADRTLAMAQGASGVDGYLAATDWAKFTKSVVLGGLVRATGVRFVQGYLSASVSGDADIIDASTGSLYSPASGKRAMCMAWTIFNSSGASPTSYFTVKISGTYYQITSNIATNATSTSINSSTTLGFILEHNESLGFHSTQPNVCVFVQIIEFDSTVPLKTVHTVGLTSGANTLYTVPSTTTTFIIDTNSQENSNTGRILAVSNGGTTYAANMVKSGGTTGNTNKITLVSDASFSSLRIAINTIATMAAGDFINLTVATTDSTAIAWVNVIEWANGS